MAELIYRGQHDKSHKCEDELPPTYTDEARNIPPGSILLCSCGRKWRRGNMLGEKKLVVWRRHLRPMWFKNLEKK